MTTLKQFNRTFLQLLYTIIAVIVFTAILGLNSCKTLHKSSSKHVLNKDSTSHLSEVIKKETLLKSDDISKTDWEYDNTKETGTEESGLAGTIDDGPDTTTIKTDGIEFQTFPIKNGKTGFTVKAKPKGTKETTHVKGSNVDSNHTEAVSHKEEVKKEDTHVAIKAIDTDKNKDVTHPTLGLYAGVAFLLFAIVIIWFARKYLAKKESQNG